MKKSILITVLTPTYNRASLLPLVYNSLVKQTYKMFEWLIVDDGSTDNTRSVISSFKMNNNIDIKYIYQENGGKYKAINTAIDNANGEALLILDSDDILTSTGLEKMVSIYFQIRDNSQFLGVLAPRYSFDKVPIVDNLEKLKGRTIDATRFDINYRYKMMGDMVELMKLDILKNYKFPIIDKENFMAESVLHNRLSKNGFKYRCFDDIIYLCEYRSDGLSAKSIRLRRNNFLASNVLYREMLEMPKIPFFLKVKSSINLWRFALANKSIFISTLRSKNTSLFTKLFIPFGLLFFIKDSLN